MSSTTPDRDFLLALAHTDVFTPLPATTLAAVLASPPFVSIPDTFNARDLGLVPGSPIPPGRLYRTAVFPTEVSAEGRAALRERLGVGRMVDLRTAGERARRPEPAVDGVEEIWIEPEEGLAPNLDDFGEGEGEKGAVRMYLDVLRLYRGGIRAVLEQVRDGWERGAVLFHCNAGRDRTGVVAAILLSLAGAGAETIALDYLLSRIGIEPAKEQLLAYVTKGRMAANMDARGFRNMANLKLGCWEAFVKAVDAEYGGFEGYVRGPLGLSEEDVAKIKNNLVFPN
ncbi:hypothetical protein MYCTH_2300403 [Thermothelomyces thermophilus ATCC 42464]|uniref:Tyrosine specific protein phosphatases domain-containing protein n=1 Tax=Thermothelomyces thermophilus (strain ATCC 42464 / BCRC 31852 / DSM 1799) TaxID=573729 RepID=G2Q792_THET4|nr:uncharacterized protein MYCTH_2300403 [Thermothelomyces thermophilus ATCC 42464]AEO56003.1 hypothetical protein MYCTH_2300403 [Thermothelomyces thermophilus ATCC 42464]